MKRVIIALLVFFSGLSIHTIDAQAQVGRMDTTSSQPAATSNFGVGLQTFPLPGITAQARLGEALFIQLGVLPTTPRVVPGEAFVGARIIRDVYRLPMARFFVSAGYAFNLLMESPSHDAVEILNRYGFGSAGAEWISRSGFGVSLEAVYTIMARPRFNTRLLPSGLGAGFLYHF